jgi:uncharacterized membrane protein
MSLISILSLVELILSFVGTGIAGTLYFAHRNNIELPCSTGGGCDLVNASHWAHFYGFPVSLIGIAGYGVLAMLSVLKLNAPDRRAQGILRLIMLIMTGGAVAFSWYLQYVAAVFIGAFCIYCRSSAIVITLLFAMLVFETVRAAGTKPPAVVPIGTSASDL